MLESQLGSVISAPLPAPRRLPNARRQVRQIAGAQRTLPAVTCTPLFGAGFGTDTGTLSSCWPGAAWSTDTAPMTPPTLRRCFMGTQPGFTPKGYGHLSHSRKEAPHASQCV